MLYHEWKSKNCLGALFKNGDKWRIIFTFATDCKRLLQGTCIYYLISSIYFLINTVYVLKTNPHVYLQMGQFYYSAKAFDMLERLDPNPEYWEGKRGAAIGHFQLVVAGKEERTSLSDIVQILKNTTNPQTDHIVKIMKKWAKDNRLQL